MPSSFLSEQQTLEEPSKTVANDTFIFYFDLLKKIRLDVLCESSAKQRIHMEYQVLFSWKKKDKKKTKKKYSRLPSAAVMIGALRVKSSIESFYIHTW